MPTPARLARVRAFFRRTVWRFVRALMIAGAGVGPVPPRPPPPAPAPTEQVEEESEDE